MLELQHALSLISELTCSSRLDRASEANPGNCSQPVSGTGYGSLSGIAEDSEPFFGVQF